MTAQSGVDPVGNRAFRGWWMVLFCTIVRGATVPGQTIGVSAFIDDFIEALGISRSAVSTAYLVGTLAGAVALPAIGRWVDRVGVRHAMTIVGAAFASVVALTSTVQNVVMLGVAFVGLRMLGQGALSLIGSTGVTLWFEKRRGFALAVSGMGTLAVLSGAPYVFGKLIDAVGWRSAWLVLGAAVAAIVLPIARFAITDRPEDIGQLPDGAVVDGDVTVIRGRSYTVSEAIRTPAFWTLGVLTGLMAALITGLTFHNTDIMGAQGLTEDEAAAIFVPQLVGSVSFSFAIGWLTDRLPSRPLMVFGGLAVALGVFMASTAAPGPRALAYGFVTGVAIGTMTALGGTLYPKWFGVDHIASIRGLAGVFGVAGSALGPLILSLGNDVSGSYEPVIVISALVSLGLAIVAVFIPTPAR